MHGKRSNNKHHGRIDRLLHNPRTKQILPIRKRLKRNWHPNTRPKPCLHDHKHNQIQLLHKKKPVHCNRSSTRKRNPTHESHGMAQKQPHQKHNYQQKIQTNTPHRKHASEEDHPEDKREERQPQRRCKHTPPSSCPIHPHTTLKTQPRTNGTHPTHHPSSSMHSTNQHQTNKPMQTSHSRSNTTNTEQIPPTKS